VKLVAAAPIRHWQLDGYPSPCGTKVIQSRVTDLPIALALYQSPHGRELLSRARAGLIIFPIALMLAVFLAARSWLGYTAAAVAALSITFEPTLLAHGSLVTTDMALTAMTFVAVVISIECVRKQSWIYFVLCGIALGLAVASKHSGFVVPFICLATMLASALVQRPRSQELPSTDLWLGRSLRAGICDLVGILWFPLCRSAPRASACL
jgi:predicted membrane-bound mannosyltransferase